jgi:hypothetical protein
MKTFSTPHHSQNDVDEGMKNGWYGNFWLGILENAVEFLELFRGDFGYLFSNLFDI